MWHSLSRPGRVREAVATQATELRLHLESHTQETRISAPRAVPQTEASGLWGAAAGTLPQTEGRGYRAPRGPSRSGLQAHGPNSTHGPGEQIINNLKQPNQTEA